MLEQTTEVFGFEVEAGARRGAAIRTGGVRVAGTAPRATARARVATLGASFGAYHAVNFAFRHPDLCDKCVGFSGKYDIHSFLDGYWDELCYFHCPTANVPNMDSEWMWKLSSMDIAIVTGETDNILEGSKQMIGILEAKGIRHRGDIWSAPYGQDWPWWKVQIRSYVP